MKYFKLFASCIPVRGHSNFVITDTQRGEIYNITEGLFEILTIHIDEEILSIKSIYDNKYDSEIEYYFQFLTENELGFYCNNPDSFPKLDLSFETPEMITNVIIEHSQKSEKLLDWKKISKEILTTKCKFLELRFYDEVSIQLLENIILELKKTELRNISIICKYSSELQKVDFDNFLIKHQRVGEIIMHSAPNEEVLFDNFRVKTITQSILDNSTCGQIDKKHFRLNLKMFTESNCYNNCLHKKLSISASGKVKNCPSAKTSIGNIHEDNIISKLQDREFQHSVKELSSVRPV